MPLFHFNVFDGVVDLDKEGTELPNVDAAWREARLLASDIIKSDSEWNKLGDDWRIEVTDDAGVILFRIDVGAMKSPLMRAERGIT